MTLAAARSPKLELCELDEWVFDPRYTDGRCPICGWTPEGAVSPQPEWMVRARRLPWDFIALGVLFVGLVVLGIIVGAAAGINLLPKGY